MQLFQVVQIDFQALLSFVIPKEVVNSLSSSSFENLYLGLYTDEATLDAANNFAAICKLNLTKNNLVNASLVVDWELVISNISRESTTSREE